MNDCVIEIKAVEWSGESEDFHLVRSLIECKAVGLRCIHCTILDDVVRAAYQAGTDAMRKKKQELFWALRICSFSPQYSTWSDEYPITRTVEPGTVFWKFIISWVSKSQTMTEEMICSEYSAVLNSFSSVFRGNWDKYQEAVCYGMIVF